MPDAAPRRALILLPQEGFDDEAYRHVRSFLQTRAVKVQVAAAATTAAKGERVDETAPDLALDAVDASAFDAAVVIGGIGGRALEADPRVHRILRTVAERGGVVAASGTGTLALARAGVLRGRRVTGDPDRREEIVEAGGHWKGGEVVVDGRIVTASPGANLRLARSVGALLGR